MNFAFLWVDALAIALLWFAMMSAFIGRLKRRWLRGVLGLASFTTALFPLGAFVVFATGMKFSARIMPDWFNYALSLLLAYFLGILLILLLAESTNWRRGPLAFAWLTSIAFGYTTLMNMDLAVRTRCATLSTDINSLYLATLPAITSESQNAAPLYDTAFARLRDDQKLEETVHNPPTGDHDTFDPNEPATIAFLKTEDATIALLRRAAALPACRFDQDLRIQDIEVVLSNLNQTRNAANVLNLHAREEIANGHVASAIADATAIIGMSRHIGQRPTLVSALVGIGIAAVGDKTLEEALPFVTRKEELASLHLQDVPSMGRIFQQALRGEERYGLLLYGNTPQGVGSDANRNSLMGPHAGVAGAFFRTFILDLDDYVKRMSRFQDASSRPHYLVADSASHVFGMDHSHGLMTSIVGPSFSRALKTLGTIEATDACAQIAVAMTNFRMDHGSYPANLNDLVPQYLDTLPLDPFNGQSIQLAQTGNRVVLSSVGPLNGSGTGAIHFTLISTTSTSNAK